MPIIKSLLDTDLYKLTMGQVALHQFPWVNVRYKFKCRNASNWTEKHLVRLKEEVQHFCQLRFKEDELSFLHDIRFFKNSYIDFLRLYSPDINHIAFGVVDAGKRRVLCVTRDMTARKNLEAQIFQERKMEAIGQLAGGIAHDFNNLLTAIQGNVELLSLDLEKHGGNSSYVDSISHAVRLSTSLTRQLLAFSRKQSVVPEIVNLADVLGNVAELLKRFVGEHIVLDVLTASNLYSVYADPGQLEQIVINLVINSRDAMPEGGRIAIDLRNAMGEGEEPLICLTVTDSGVGIPEGDLDRIFEPFYTTKEHGKGTGLGLATIHGIVRQFNGRIEVDSILERGSTFRVFLPATNEVANKAHQESREDTSSLIGNVLLVEDNDLVRETVRRYLEMRGFGVVEARHGKEALNFLDTDDEMMLVLSDVIMPEMGGVELANALAKSRPDLKVLLMSGYNDQVLSNQGDVADYPLIEKPFTHRALSEKIHKVLACN